MSTEPSIRLHLFHARDTTRTVILRQGPTRTYRMILWDRDGDRFQDGQWLKHKVYVERCDLSPDGEHFLYFTLDGQWNAPTKGSYTVICKPPYFTALRLYPQGDTYGGGGYFIDPVRFYVHSSRTTTDLIGCAESLERVFRPEPKWFSRFDPFSHVDAEDNPLSLDTVTRDWLSAKRPGPAMEEYETEGACLYRRKEGARHLIRDFSDMTFEPVIAPYAPPKAWHPLNGDKT
jgi:hypothetical protein